MSEAVGWNTSLYIRYQKEGGHFRSHIGQYTQMHLGMVANAPHIPVHLGAMQSAVRFQVEYWNSEGREGIKEGDGYAQQYCRSHGFPLLTYLCLSAHAQHQSSTCGVDLLSPNHNCNQWNISLLTSILPTELDFGQSFSCHSHLGDIIRRVIQRNIR